ncbi:class I SAM-dependent methyltransferase [Candidatus Magnetominusculus xianensis]|uniref:Methyltransferase n=1 Tax=Candidatus Magnetominusculus xianensis TaxID=1748249 RepID=A0ABR5SGU0_9BACT|nr:class I SAM-dependent methyltransferase [Candidatus Magnetominusculus xianensis]KWT90533.1 methyltransferase [Candidatus Magnetominusculus xianensis]MBF0404142.1 class I SAM-dependent methyltransferase [Nitrospirota bacterium]
MKNKALCKICGSETDDLIISSIAGEFDTYDVFYCRGCAVGITTPVPTAEELKKLYTVGSYREKTGKRFIPFVENFILYFRHKRKNRIKKYIKTGRILDIGCGRGLFLNVMKEDGWEVAGVEFDEAAASNAASYYGIEVISGEPQTWRFAPASFDVITLNHVLEHIPNPKELIQACHRLLKSSGLLIIAVPNLDGIQSKAGRKNWFHLDVPYHLYHFSDKGISSLLTAVSFNIDRKRHFDLEYSPFGWLQTLLNITGVQRNMLYELLKAPRRWKSALIAARLQDIILTALVVPLYTSLSMVFSLFESFVAGRGGIVELYALKAEGQDDTK